MTAKKGIAEPIDYVPRVAFDIVVSHDRIAYGLELKTRLMDKPA